MNTSWMDIAAGRGALALGLIVAGVVVVGVLIGAFALGVRVKRREPPTPTPEEQPRLPEEGPVREVRENREPDEVPRSNDRFTPHQIPKHGNAGTRTSSSTHRPRWDEGSSGSFGSGGAGGR
ncbi:DUF6479 family protein [Streptomyces sp. NPDC006602]|uniref:DUF6479 family protein n=1 Tax=Streptomyces sp. NPDC006602 TaxID=3364751 RepID=UPI00367E5DC0